MSSVIPPIQPVEPVSLVEAVAGNATMDPGLYQTMATSLIELFQKARSNDTSIMPLSLSIVSLIGIISLRNERRSEKKYLKKDKKDNQKLAAIFKKIWKEK